MADLSVAAENPGAFPVLERPPIIEVVCGFVFDALPIDALVLGVYWDEHRDQYERGELQLAMSDTPEFTVGPAPMRVILSSAGDARHLQVQHDRLHVNWRGKAESYPRFSAREGRPGLLSSALEELARLSAFCRARFGVEPQVRRVELVKVDLIERGAHWSDMEDLASLFPMAASFQRSREFLVRFLEDRPPRTIVTVNSMTPAKGGDVAAVRIEARAAHVLAAGESPDSGLKFANDAVNRAFFDLLAPDQLARFGVGGES